MARTATLASPSNHPWGRSYHREDVIIHRELGKMMEDVIMLITHPMYGLTILVLSSTLNGEAMLPIDTERLHSALQNQGPGSWYSWCCQGTKGLRLGLASWLEIKVINLQFHFWFHDDCIPLLSSLPHGWLVQSSLAVAPYPHPLDIVGMSPANSAASPSSASLCFHPSKVPLLEER